MYATAMMYEVMRLNHDINVQRIVKDFQHKAEKEERKAV